MKRIGILAAIAAAAIGCTGGGAPATPGPAPVDPKLATVKFAVAFPKQGMRSVIDPNAAVIRVRAMSDQAMMEYGPVELTPANQTGTLTLPVGNYVFWAEELDAAGAVLENAYTGGKVLAGSNSVVLSFLSAEWTLGTPITFSTGAELTGFELAYADSTAAGYANAFEKNIPSVSNGGYALTYRLDVPVLRAVNGVTRVRHVTQFGGGTVNRSAFDGGGYDLVALCGEQQGGPYPGSCAKDGPPAPGSTSIRIIGQLDRGDDCGNCSLGDRTVRALVPAQQFVPDLRPLANSHLVSGTRIDGTIIEYGFVSMSQELLELTGPFTPPPPAAVPPATPDAAFATTLTEYRMAVVCRDGFNGRTPDGIVDTGSWHLEGGQDVDGDGTPDYWDRGWLDGYMGPPDVGECNYGLEKTDNPGEWCDGWWDSFNHVCNGPGDGVALPWEFVDMNGDGVVDLGSFYLRFLGKQEIRITGRSYSFTATGVALDRSTSIVIQ